MAAIGREEEDQPLIAIGQFTLKLMMCCAVLCCALLTLYLLCCVVPRLFSAMLLALLC
jgi:hypothetical protein